MSQDNRPADVVLEDGWLKRQVCEVRKDAHVQGVIQRAREVARANGWAIGVHGSLDRDIDLIAVPWVAEACSMDALIAALRAEFGITLHGNYQSRRPHNRQSFLLLSDDAESQQERFNEGRDPGPVHPKGIWYPPAIDLSVIDPREAATP